jgi:hypothetical protein
MTAPDPKDLLALPSDEERRRLADAAADLLDACRKGLDYDAAINRMTCTQAGLSRLYSEWIAATKKAVAKADPTGDRR